MRILWATSHLPDPSRGGGWAFEFELLRSACERHEVVLVCATSETEPVAPAIRELGIAVRTTAWEPIAPPRSPIELLWRVVRVPTGGALAHVPRVAAALAEEVARAESAAPYDVVVVYPGEMAEVAASTVAPSALFLTDVHSRQRERELAHARTWRQRLLWWAELRTMRRWERRWYVKADRLTTVTAIDAGALAALTGCEAEVIPLMIGAEWFAPPTVDRTDHVVTFIGALDYRPNIDAIRWFVDAVWPAVVAACPHARLRVVGRAPVDEVAEAVRRAGAELLADVPDIRPYYWEAAIVVAPIRLGSGMRTKILHAAATGAPLVATPTAIEGIDIEPVDHVAVASDAVAFASLVIADLDDRRQALARAAASVKVAAAYAPEEVHARLEGFLARTASTAPRRH